jgi:hypothetical protein
LLSEMRQSNGDDEGDGHGEEVVSKVKVVWLVLEGFVQSRW